MSGGISETGISDLLAGGGQFSRRSALAALVSGSALGAAQPYRAALNREALNREATAGTGTPAQAGTFPWQRLLGDLAVNSGPYQGAYRSLPGGPVNWYFANIGLWFFVESMPDNVRDYLDAYIRSIDPVLSSINDVAADLTTPVSPDSHDAYAGTLLRLAVRYATIAGDSAWWTANLASLKRIAYSNILAQIKPNGMVRVFQAPASNGTGYLMDQCEAYAGLRDFGQLLLATGDPDSMYNASFAVNLGNAIHSMYNSSQNRWNWCDVPSPSANTWYPNLTAQIYPQLYDVHSNDAPGDYARLNAGYTVLEAGAADWTSRPQDLYPWLVVGYYAATCLNRTDLALEMLAMVNRYYLPGTFNTGRFLISDIGYVAGIGQAAAGANQNSKKKLAEAVARR
jgi:hypothetical protein